MIINPKKDEIAAPFGLAMTCNDIYCVRISKGRAIIIPSFHDSIIPFGNGGR